MKFRVKKQFNNTIAGLFLLAVLLLSGITPALAINFDSSSRRYNNSLTNEIELHGSLQELSSISSIADCTDNALSFVNCDGWLSNRPSNGDFKGTTVIIDTALSVNEWKDLEIEHPSGVSVDIIRYVTDDGNGNPIEYGSSGQDSLSGVSDSDLGHVSGYNHGHKVLTVYGQIARDSKVIFISIDVGSGYGFKYLDRNTAVWDWIYNHRNTYDISVVSMSWSSNPSLGDLVNSRINDLYNAGIYMVSSIGNDGQYRGDKFPQEHQYVYGVGSVDHEDRGTWIWDWFGSHWDGDYYSNKGGFTGSAQDAKDHPSDCLDGSKTPFCSSYGINQADHPFAIDFVMPGHGVPVRSETFQTFYYSWGTSFSTPYLAAAAIVAVYGFNMGHFAAGNYYIDPTASQIHALLKGAASRSTFSQRMGYGYIDLLELYNEAYDLGRSSYVYCDYFMRLYDLC